MANVTFYWNDQITKEIRDIGKGAIQLECMDLQQKSAKEAPKETGDLESNCHVDPEFTETNDFVYKKVGYDLPYALRQHEHTEYNHPLKGKAKFLEDPYKENYNRYMAFIIKKIKDFIK